MNNIEIKKPVHPDVNSWLIPYIVRYFKSLEVAPGISLWDEMVLCFKPDSNECEYLAGTSNDDNLLYPVLSYDQKNHKVSLMRLEWICSKVFDLKTGNYLDVNQMKLINQKKEEVKSMDANLNKSVKPKKGFFAWLASLFKKNKKVENVEPRIKPVEKTSAIMDTPKKSYYDDIKSYSIEEGAAKLVEYNGVELYEAKEELLSSSYHRNASRRLFVSHLENDRDLGLDVLKVKFDLSFLYNSGFFNHESSKEFKKKIGNLHQVELEFEIQSPEITIDPFLEETQLIKISSNN